MRKIQLKDVLDIAQYERRRREIRQRVMAVKQKRRFFVGPKVTFLFENFDTMLYQVQEMTRAERIVDEKGIRGELNAYNELIPDKNQLSASLLIEIDDIDERKTFLSRIVDLPVHTYLAIGADRITAEFDPRQGTPDKLSSVQYLKFNLTDEQVKKFSKADISIKLGFDHPLYSYEYELDAQNKQTLLEDLTNKQPVSSG